MPINLFNTKNISLLNPYAIESLYHLGVFIKDKNLNLELNRLKDLTLEAFTYLIENNIVYVLERNCMGNKEFNKLKLSKNNIIRAAKEKLLSLENFDELYDFFWFKYQDWYRLGLENNGLSYTVNWNKFIEDNIGDLRQWIDKNKST